MTQVNDIHFLQHAARLAARHLGRTWPNPSVGCVLVKDGQVVGTGITEEGGRPHAETQALQVAGDRARGATAYVTLEPCAHHGQTPPCAQALIDAGIVRVVMAAVDSDARVNGKGVAMLRDAHIEVQHMPLPEVDRQLCGFFRRTHHAVPLVLMKLATSADGMMADPAAKQRWITNEASRAHGHLLRSMVDAVLTGVGTTLADNPMLNVRLPGITHRRLVRVIADRHLRTPLDAQLVRTAEHLPCWIITSAAAIEQQASHATDLRERGVKLIALDDEQLPPHAILKALAAEGITRLLVEAGPALSTAFLEEKLVDQLYWYRAPIMLGNAGQLALPGLHSQLTRASEDAVRTTRRFGDDVCEIFELKSCLPD